MSEFERLMAYIAELRQSDAGCPWTQSQTIASLLPQTREECDELIQAFEQETEAAFAAELGDLLYHVAFYCVISCEQRDISARQYLKEAIDAIIAKHESRLPPRETRQQYSASEINDYWQRRKNVNASSSLFPSSTVPQPTFSFATQCQTTAATIGFDWPSVSGVLDKLDEEMQELKAAVTDGLDKKQIEDEIGDVLFTCVNVARHCQIDPENALHQANIKFVRRFKKLEKIATEQKIDVASASLNELEQLWQAVKKNEL